MFYSLYCWKESTKKIQYSKVQLIGPLNIIDHLFLVGLFNVITYHYQYQLANETNLFLSWGLSEG